MSETGQIADGFTQRGYRVVPFGEPSDVVFLNTCTVTDGADSSCRNMIRKAHRASPEGQIVVAGCYAQMEAEKIKKIEGVDLILGTTEKYKVFDHLEAHQEQLVKIDQSTEFYQAQTTQSDSHTRAFLKIQDGCNYVCSFCIIPHARGRSRTLDIKTAVESAKKIVGDGYKEIVLTGVNIGEYESTSKEKLSDMVKAIGDIQGLERLRLSSVEPNTISRELLVALKSTGKYQNHFHVPLQSGCDEILKSMRRKYDMSFYKDVMSLIQDEFPGAAIGADIIAGYPGESEEQFLKTYEYLAKSEHTHFHVFPYSRRQKTTAAKLPHQLQVELKKKRVNELRALGEQKLTQLRDKLSGRTLKVLFEQRKGDYFEGNAPEFTKVRVQTDADLSNQIHDVLIGEQVMGVNLGKLLQ